MNTFERRDPLRNCSVSITRLRAKILINLKIERSNTFKAQIKFLKLFQPSRTLGFVIYIFQNIYLTSMSDS